MTKDVIITISGLQFAPGDEKGEEPVAVTSSGVYHFRDGKHYVLYDEVTEDTGEVIKNQLKISKSGIELTKRGIANVKMVFEEGKKNLSCYSLPFGSLMMGMDASKIEVSETESQIKARIDYGLEVNYEKVADCVINIEIISKETGEFHL